MPKNKVEAPKHELTKRQLTHWQRQNRIQRFTLWGGIAVVAAVVILVFVGIYFSNIRPTQKVVFKVGETSYNTGYYADALDFYGKQNYAFIQNYGIDYSQYMSYMASSVAVTIQQNQIYKEAAAAFEPPITVSDDEIENYVKENKLTNNKATRDSVYGILLDEKLTNKYDKALPESAEHRAVLAMFVESQSEVDNVTSRIAKGETFKDIAEAESLDSSSKNKAGDLGWVPSGVLPSLINEPQDKTLDELVFDPSTQVNVLTQREDPTKSKTRGYWVIQVTDYKTNEENGVTTSPNAISEAKVNVMLLGSHEMALDMQKQLENGADFATLAKANSQYTEAATNGGILEYTKKGTLGDTLDAILFADNATTVMPEGKISDPISDTLATTGGFWLVQVTGIENKTLEGDNRSTLANIDKNTWKETAWAAKSDTVVDQMDAEKSSWAMQQAISRLNK